MWFWKKKPPPQHAHPLDTLGEIRRLLHDFYPERRALGCYRAMKLGIGAEILIPDLIRRSVDREAVVREGACDALAAIGLPAVRPLCDQLLEDDQHRNMARVALARLGAIALDELVELVLTRVPDYAHLARIASLELIRAQGTAAFHGCLRLLNSDDATANCEAESHLMSLGAALLPSIEQQLRFGGCSERQTRKLAILLARIGPPALVLLIRMLITRTNESYRAAGAAALVAFLRNDPERPEPADIPRLRRLMPTLLRNLNGILGEHLSPEALEVARVTLLVLEYLAPYGTEAFRQQAASAVVFLSMNRDARWSRALGEFERALGGAADALELCLC